MFSTGSAVLDVHKFSLEKKRGVTGLQQIMALNFHTAQSVFRRNKSAYLYIYHLFIKRGWFSHCYKVQKEKGGSICLLLSTGSSTAHFAFCQVLVELNL